MFSANSQEGCSVRHERSFVLQAKETNMIKFMTHLAILHLQTVTRPALLQIKNKTAPFFRRYSRGHWAQVFVFPDHSISAAEELSPSSVNLVS